MTAGVVAARVVEVFDHPHAATQWIADVDPGDGWLRRVVFGGTYRLRPGEVVPYAQPGTRLPGRKRMRRRQVRGIPSDGMLCSLDELGWTDGGPNAVAVLPGLPAGLRLITTKSPHPLAAGGTGPREDGGVARVGSS